MASSRLRRYYILSKPGIVYANVLTAAAGYLYASGFHINVTTLAGLVVGLALLIAGACAYNNYLDRSIDAAMVRTQKRGLVTGELNVRQALAFASVATAGGLLLLALTQNGITLLLAVVALIDYVVLYGIGKRKTVHGTLIGTVSGAIPLVAGYTAVTGQLDLEAWLLFALMFTWQMAHFYAIALYRQHDYEAVSLPVMPAVRGVSTTKRWTVVYIALFLGATICLIVFGQLGYVAGSLLGGLGLWWLVKAWRSYNTLSPAAWGRETFFASLKVVMAISLCIAFGPLLL